MVSCNQNNMFEQLEGFLVIHHQKEQIQHNYLKFPLTL